MIIRNIKVRTKDRRIVRLTRFLIWRVTRFGVLAFGNYGGPRYNNFACRMVWRCLVKQSLVFGLPFTLERINREARKR